MMSPFSLLWTIAMMACTSSSGEGEQWPQSRPVQVETASEGELWVPIEHELELVGAADVVLFGQSTLSSDLVGQLDYLWYSYASAGFFSSPTGFAMIPDMGDYCVVAAGPFPLPDRDVGSSVSFTLDGLAHVMRREGDGVETSYAWYGPIVEATDGSEHREADVAFEELGIGGRFPQMPDVNGVEDVLVELEETGVLHLRWVPVNPTPGVMMGLSVWPYSFTDKGSLTSGVLWCQFTDDGEAIVDFRPVWASYTVAQMVFSRTEFTLVSNSDWGDVALWLYSDMDFRYHRRLRLYSPVNHP